MEHQVPPEGTFPKGYLRKGQKEYPVIGSGTEPGNSGYSQRVAPLYSAKLGFSLDIPLSTRRLARNLRICLSRVRFLSRFVGAGEVRRQDKRQGKFAALSTQGAFCLAFVVPGCRLTVASPFEGKGRPPACPGG